MNVKRRAASLLLRVLPGERSSISIAPIEPGNVR
jgi:hypothetical protein